MNFKEFIESLGQALGMRLENAGGACGLEVDGVTVMIHDADDLVLLTAEIGPPPPEEGLETLFSTSPRPPEPGATLSPASSPTFLPAAILRVIWPSATSCRCSDTAGKRRTSL